ncbi:MAG: Fic family protein [Candidatus Nanoarchaeia archaeon]|jgi:Fic family protein
MAYTETKVQGKNKYYYRTKSLRKAAKVQKKRIYLGKNLSTRELKLKETKADSELLFLGNLLMNDEIEELERIRLRYIKEPKENFENRYESFCAFFTYDSNAIEGNTITLRETADLLFEKIVPNSKSLREVNETINHRAAFDYMLEYRGDITRKFILAIHQIIIKETLRQDLIGQEGKYRNVQVYIRGVKEVPPPPSAVPVEMRKLLFWYSTNKQKLHPLVVASYFHIAFELIHPFVDGNGRAGRLLMNFILHKKGYPMINIPNARKREYYDLLHDAQVNGNIRGFALLLMDLLKNQSIMF